MNKRNNIKHTCLQAELGLSTINNRLPSEDSAGTDLEARLVLIVISVFMSGPPISLNRVRSMNVSNPALSGILCIET